MKITVVLKESIYDCKIKITDSCGERDYYISATCEDGLNSSSIVVDVFDNKFSISLIPIMPDLNPMLNEFKPNNWKEKLATKAMNLLLNSVEKNILRVGCNYNIVNLQDGDRLDITLQMYVYGTFDRFDILELIPMIYAFFEVTNFNDRFELTDAYETNRKDVLKFAKTMNLIEFVGDGLFTALIMYPIQVSRIKRLTKNKKILKTLTKFNKLSDKDRQRFLEKQEKFLDR